MSPVDTAFSILMERFPSLALTVHQFDPLEPVEESLPSISLEPFELLYIYGVGRGEGYFQVKEWLHRDPSRQLVFLEDEAGILRSFLEREEAPIILQDPQVHFELLTPDGLESLTRKFARQRVELVSLPSKKRGKKLRLEILRKTTLSYAIWYDRIHGDELFQNFLQNLNHLPRSFYANGLKGAFANVPAVVCGAGPSLAATIDSLKHLENRALIIAGGSTLAALSSRGITPHFGMALDPNEEEYLRMRNSFAFEMPLLYSTRVHPGTFQTMNGPFGYLRSGIGGLMELWIEEELGFQEPLLAHFSQETLSVTAICIGWAQFLGCNPILLNGIDLAYTGKRRYSPGVAKEVPLREMDPHKAALDRLLKRKGRDGKWVDTAVRWVMESAAISDFAKRHRSTQFINTTSGGLGFKGIGYLPFDEAVQGFGERELRKEVLEKIFSSPMPTHSQEVIEKKVGELKESLSRSIEQLQILNGEKKGSKALAELELKEEIAYVVLLSSLEELFASPEPFWKEALALATKSCDKLRVSGRMSSS